MPPTVTVTVGAGSEGEKTAALATLPAPTIAATPPEPRAASLTRGGREFWPALGREWPTLLTRLPRRWIYAAAIACAGVLVGIGLMRVALPRLGLRAPERPSDAAPCR